MFNGTRGDQLVVDLHTDDFDPYLIVEAPSGKQFDNDNFEGNKHRSLLNLTLEETGDFEISTTSFQKGETGPYTLTLTPQRADGPLITNYDGRLAAGDETLSEGEFVDTFEFVGTPGRHVKIDLSSSDFDTYVMLFSPSNVRTINDDSAVANHSIIHADLTEAGTYRVRVTSYEAKKAGAYHLRIERAGAPTAAQQSARDITNLVLGRAATGQLAAGDLEPQPGKYQDVYAFTANAGQNIRVDVTSRDFDTYLTVRTPSGKDITNDDFEASSSRSVVDLTLPETGRYQIFVTSYDDKETGNYTVTASLRTGAVANAIAPRAGGTVYGVFVGVSDYGGCANPLRFTADDPVNVRDALIRSAGLQARNAITLTNGAATVANVRRAFSDLAPRIGPNDTFVFFFSGHGSQRERLTGPEPADADGIDETVEFYDAPMIDNEFATMFDQIHAAASLVILDSCFSGGFAKDLVSKPGRMGLFSSDEDVTSLVAEKFRAGGYLAAFVRDGIIDGRADDDHDHRINALELSQYLHQRYAGESQVKSMTAVLADSFNYQHLVVDRGGVGPYAVLFALP